MGTLMGGSSRLAVYHQVTAANGLFEAKAKAKAKTKAKAKAKTKAKAEGKKH